MQIAVPKTYSHLAPLPCDLARVGRLGDGGYVIPAVDKFGIEALLSIGISDDWSFEREIAKDSSRCVIHGYDRTSGSTVFVYYLMRVILSNQNISRKIILIKKWLFLAFSFAFFWNRRHKFYRKWIVLEKKNKKEISIAEAFNKIPVDQKIGIKIDIEGNEYEIGDQLVDQIIKRNSNVRFIVMEFHGISKNRDRFIELTQSIQSMFSVAHIHANNFGGIGSDGFPEVIEVTFSSSLDSNELKKRSTPNGAFDKPCNPLLEDFELVFDL
jgi:hypothetical protein